MKFRIATALFLSLVVTLTGLRLAAASSDGDPPEKRVLSGEVIERALQSARERYAGQPLPEGFRLLAELAVVEGTTKPGPVVLTPQVMSQLAAAGMRPYLRRLGIRLAGGGGGSYASSAGGPSVTWSAPAPSASLAPEVSLDLQWTTSDPDGVAFVDLLASYDGGSTFLPIVLGLSGTDTIWPWFPPTRPGATTLRIEATDNLMNTTQADLAVTIQPSSAGTILPSTLRDFDMPGTQPHEDGFDTFDPVNCSICHGGWDPNTEPFFGWSGSMMANASIDPFYEACLTIAEQDAEGSGDLCIRCHAPKGWMEGRSVPTDGSEILDQDRIGVSCDHCHRMVDPVYDAGVSPPEDLSILADLVLGPPNAPGTGLYVIDPTGMRRGPFDDAICDQVAHPFLASPYHSESEMCATCHNVSNPAYENDGMGNYVPTWDTPPSSIAVTHVAPVERTFSEWQASDFNTPGGVYNPAMGGNKDFVSSCQDCHMRDATGTGCNPSFFPSAPVRNDLPTHDLTGGNTWVPSILDDLYPGVVDPMALAAASQRALYMLQNSAELSATFADGATFAADGTLTVRVANETGHKLPTGYPEGRRMWLNVKFFDKDGNVVKESGAYDFTTAVLTVDGEAKVYEAKFGLDAAAAALTGLPEAESFHFVLNNKVYKDNRIPPLGFTNAAFAAFGGAPVGATYADGQNWDETTYAAPSDALTAQVTLYYQSASKEYIEFLRDQINGDASTLRGHGSRSAAAACRARASVVGAVGEWGRGGGR